MESDPAASVGASERGREDHSAGHEDAEPEQDGGDVGDQVIVKVDVHAVTLGAARARVRGAGQTIRIGHRLQRG